MVTSPSGVTVDAGRHAEVDDVAAELGVDDAAEQLQDLVGGRRRRRDRVTTAILPVRRRVNSIPWPIDAGIPRLDVLKALGDNTRYAIYLELARSPAPLATADIAEALGLHPNTVRPHLERMREVGLLEVAHRGPLGRRPAAAPLLAWRRRRPSLGLEPPTFPMLARMLVRLAEATGASGDDAAEVGREQGRGRRRPPRPRPLVPRGARRPSSTASASTRRSTAPTTARPPSSPSPTARSASWPRPTPSSSARCTAAWSRASSTASGGGEVDDFHPLVHREPCQVTHLQSR